MLQLSQKKPLCQYLFQSTKKLAAVLVLSMLITEARKKADPAVLLKRVLCIYHPMQFKKAKTKVQTLLNSDSNINVMTLVYTAKMCLKV